MKRRLPFGTPRPTLTDSVDLLATIRSPQSKYYHDDNNTKCHWGRISICMWVSMVFIVFPLFRIERKIVERKRQHKLQEKLELQIPRESQQQETTLQPNATDVMLLFQQQQFNISDAEDSNLPETSHETILSTTSACAICFFGLPRSFELLVLPSIVKNVLKPNQKSNKCDIFLHYYDLQSEKKSRSSVGGTLHTEDVWLLAEAQKKLNRQDGTNIHVSIVKDTEESFLQERAAQLEKYMTTKGKDGKLLYYPWMAKSYDKSSIHNIIKQWHSIDRVWQHMEEAATKLNKHYDRVAMLRNDVVYVTPFDLYQVSNTTRDDSNKQVVVPNWARFPINDRMVYGPHEAVKIWATERFQRVETHVLTYEPGYGLHSERFLNHSIFGAIRDELSMQVSTNPEVCFFRARADGTAWINDCATRDGAAIGFRNLDTAQSLVEEIAGRVCRREKFKQKIIQVDCGTTRSGDAASENEVNETKAITTS
ncbi:MAG: hypothetical protein SGILL_010133 [Bacillariaceae sp.]